MAHPVITLTTDFGLRDPYVAEMKGVILSIAPKATMVDVTHDVEKFNIRKGAFALASAVPYFPVGAVHVAVVDPSVGTERRPLLIQTKRGFLVGPDNGILSLAARNQGVEHAFEITNPRLVLPEPSNTFHGRDIFAPVAAHLANGTKPTDFGKKIHRITKPKFATIIKKENMLIGEVLYIDSYGNVVTNFTRAELESLNIGTGIRLKLGTQKITLPLCKTYAEAEKAKPVAIFGSHSFLEISMNQGNAAKHFKIGEDDRLAICQS